MDELKDRDAFVIKGQRVEIEKDRRYRILWKDGSIYEGTYIGFIETHPFCRSVTMVDVLEFKESQVVKDDEKMFYSFDKSGIVRIDVISAYDQIEYNSDIEGDGLNSN